MDGGASDGGKLISNTPNGVTRVAGHANREPDPLQTEAQGICVGVLD